jgi:dienelactone hydrolase
VYQTVDDVKAAFTFLENDPGVDETKISVVGIGWGGWRAYKLAEDVPTVHRVVIFYGVTPDDGHVPEIQAPVLAHYAQGDFLVTASSLTAHKWLGKKFTYYIYPNTERGFFGGGNAGLDVAALSGEVDLEAAAREKAKQTASSGGAANSAATTDAAKLARDRTLAFLRN